MTQLTEFPNVVKVFKKHNVLPPSSAPSERMFSHAKNILRQNRQSMTDKHFEMHLQLKINGSI